MLFVFDWDGTLIDSTGKIIRCMHQAVEEVGLEPRTDLQVQNIIGLGLPEAITRLFPGIETDAMGALRAAYSRHFIEADRIPCEFYPGVYTVLETLREQGHLLAVATGKSRRGLNRVLGNLEMTRFFDATRCADETASKPNPLMLEQLLAELNSPREQAVMIGDTTYDLAMANNAGLGSIAVSYGAHSKDQLMTQQPLHCIDHFDELLVWLRQQ